MSLPTRLAVTVALLLLLASSLAAGAPAAARFSHLTPAQRASITDVHVVYSNHVDVGFDGIAPLQGYARNVVNQYFHAFFPRAIETAANVSAATGGKQRYVWMTQCWLVSLFLDCPPSMGFTCPSAAAQEAVRAAIRAGTISWHAFPFNAELELLEPSMVSAGVGLCHALSEQFDLAPSQTLSQRDVPGTTRSALPVLNAAGVRFVSVGVNGFSASPAFPPLSIWLDQASNASVILAYHPGGYGGILRPDAVHFEGLGHVLITDWQTDNHGPHSSEDVLFDLAVISSEFPNAAVYTSSFDAFFQEVAGSPVAARLPVVTQEAGDTWVWGVASDPLKLAQFRALQRVRARCLSSSSPCDSSSAAFANFTRLLLKAAEHTWGGDTKLFLNGTNTDGSVNPDTAPYFSWSNADFARARSGKNMRDMAGTWEEQRAWGLDAPLSALPRSHPVVAEALREFKALVPSRPDTTGYKAHALDAGAVRFVSEAAGLSFGVCPTYGFVVDLTHTATGSVWSSWAHPLGALIYQTFAEVDYARFRSRYGSCAPDACPWSVFDFGKDGLDRLARPQRQDARPVVQAIWSKSGAGGGGADLDLSVLVQLRFEEGLVRDYGAPQEVWVAIDVAAGNSSASPNAGAGADAGAGPSTGAAAGAGAGGGPLLDFKVLLFNKTATRLPESLWFSFDPLRPWRQDKMAGLAAATEEEELEEAEAAEAEEEGWMLHKIASMVRARDVMFNGSQTLHALWDGAALSAPAGASSGLGERGSPLHQLHLSSLDAALVCVSPPASLSPFPALDPAVHARATPDTDALAFGLFNNIWGTNYVMWYPFREEDADLLFRFRLQLRPPSSSSGPVASAGVPADRDIRRHRDGVELREEELSSLIDEQ